MMIKSISVFSYYLLSNEIYGKSFVPLIRFPFIPKFSNFLQCFFFQKCWFRSNIFRDKTCFNILNPYYIIRFSLFFLTQHSSALRQCRIETWRREFNFTAYMVSIVTIASFEQFVKHTLDIYRKLMDVCYKSVILRKF